MNKERFFNIINNACIDYAILRNYDKIISDEEYDIDVYVEPSDMQKLLAAVFEELVGDKYEIRSYADKINIEIKLSTKTLRLDLHAALSYYGLSYVNSNQLMNYRQRAADGVWCLTGAAAALIAVLNRVLHNRPIMEKDWEVLKDLSPCHRRDLFVSLIGEDLARLVLPSIDEGVEQLLTIRNQIKSTLRRRHWRNLAREALYRLKRHFDRPRVPRGGLLVLIGTHGAGKSTTVECLRRIALASGLTVSTKHTTSRPGLLPKIGGIRKRRGVDEPKKNAGIDRAKQREDSRSAIYAITHTLRFLYHMADYWVLYAIIRIGLSRELVILDRYIYDYAVEPRNTIGVPEQLRQLLLWLAPKPNLTAILWNDPAVIHGRKDELTVQELQREIKGYLAFAQKRGIHTYRTDGKPDAIAYTIFRDFLVANGSLPSA